MTSSFDPWTFTFCGTAKLEELNAKSRGPTKPSKPSAEPTDTVTVPSGASLSATEYVEYSLSSADSRTKKLPGAPSLGGNFEILME